MPQKPSHVPNKEAFLAMLEKIAFFLELEAADPFRIRAYEEAKKTLEASEADLEGVASGKIKLKGIGPHIQALIKEYLLSGRLNLLEELNRKYPESLIELGRIPGLGARRIRVLFDRLRVASPEDLRDALEKGRLLTLEGFGKKTQETLLNQLNRFERSRLAFLLSQADLTWKTLQEGLLSRMPHARLLPAGDFRRRCPTLESVEGLVVPATETELLQGLSSPFPLLSGIEEMGGGRFMGLSEGGVAVCLSGVSEENLAQEWILKTGSEPHLKELKRRLKAKGYELELKGPQNRKESPRIEFGTEGEIYSTAGLPWIPPELREGLIEFKPSVLGNLQNLVNPEDIRGVLHVHTRFSDGMDDLEAMVARAQALGYTYIGISDHSKSAYYAKGLSEERLLEQKRAIEALRPRFPDIRIFHGVEADILPDGSLDYDESVWKELDFIVASVHSHFRMDRATMTKRVLTALKNPYLTILGHPSGRLLLSRDPYAIDMEAVIEQAARLNKAIELNAHPQRLDIDYRFGEMLLQTGVMVAINPDAHQLSGLLDVAYGVDMARKAGLSGSQILNTRPLEKVEAFFKRMDSSVWR